MTKQRLSRRELERLLYDASEALNSVLEDCFPTTPEGVAAEEERQRREGPIELPESLRNASKVLERIQENQKRRCPKCGKVGQMFTADLDWCPAEAMELRDVAQRVVEIFRPMQDKGQNGHTFELLLKRAERAIRNP